MVLAIGTMPVATTAIYHVPFTAFGALIDGSAVMIRAAVHDGIDDFTIYSGAQVWKVSLIVVMVISFHQIVDDAVGVFVPLCGQVEIDHGRVQTAMAQVLLDTANIDPCFQ